MALLTRPARWACPRRCPADPSCRPRSGRRTGASDRLPARCRSGKSRGRPGGRSGRAAGCRCAAPRAARCRARAARRRASTFWRSASQLLPWPPPALPARPDRLGSSAARSMPCSAQPLARQALGVAAQQDVHAAAGHVGGDGHRARAARLGDDAGLLLVLLGVQHVVRDALALEHLGQHLGGLDGDRADQHRLALLCSSSISSTTALNLACSDL